MARPLPAPRRLHGLGLPAAIAALAVLLRLLLPPMPMPAPDAPQDAMALLLSGGGICHSDPSTPAPGQDLPCPRCPLCAGPAAVLLPAPPALPARSAIAAPRRTLLPPATAPPATDLAIAQPRGPPALSA